MAVFEGAWPPEHEAVRRVRDALLGDPPASCREVSLRLGLARSFVDAVFYAEIEQGCPPTPCKRCNGAGVGHPLASPTESCRACRGSGINSS